MALVKSKTPEYRAYIDAKCRCINENNQKFPWYGARGIEFRFDSFDDFIAELGDRPSANHSLDRIDNEGHYESGNIRWATKYEQVHNRRDYDKPWLTGNENNAKSYVVVCPDGSRTAVTNMAKFCREHGLDKANLHATIKGERIKKHKGYSAEIAL